MLQILPFMEQNALYDQWDFTKSVSGNQAVAATDISVFYCPTRRSGVRVKDKRIMFPDWAHDNTSYDGWTQGGNDYAGCIGRRTLLPTPRRQIATTGCSVGRTMSTTSPRPEQARTEPNSVCAESLSPTSPRNSTISPTAYRIRSPSAKFRGRKRATRSRAMRRHLLGAVPYEYRRLGSSRNEHLVRDARVKAQPTTRDNSADSITTTTSPREAIIPAERTLAWPTARCISSTQPSIR